MTSVKKILTLFKMVDLRGLFEKAAEPCLLVNKLLLGPLNLMLVLLFGHPHLFILFAFCLWYLMYQIVQVFSMVNGALLLSENLAATVTVLLKNS
jgi:hypothetical protein